MRRITYQLTYIAPVIDEVLAELASTPEEFEDAMTLPDGARWVEDDGMRYLVRDYPWNDEPSDRVCTVTDATWVLDDLDDATRDTMTQRRDWKGILEAPLPPAGADVPGADVPSTPPGTRP